MVVFGVLRKKMTERQTKAGNLQNLTLLTCWTFLVFMFMLKSHSLTLSLSLDMLNNFCFHVYTQKSLLIAENYNAFFTSSSAAAPREFANHRAGSQLKMLFFLILGPKIAWS